MLLNLNVKMNKYCLISLLFCGIMAEAFSIQVVNVSYSNDDDDGHVRTGTLWTCTAHIITAVIGSGVLSLGWSTAQLGWIGGPICILFFAFITYISSALLSDCYRSPDPITGKRNHTYMDAVKTNLGRKQRLACGWLQYLNMYGTSTAYVLTTAISMRAIMQSNCRHNPQRDYGDGFYMILFGILQVLFSQIPDLHSMGWLSVIAAIMSFSYASVGFALALAKVIGNGRIKGTISGILAATPSKKMWKISQAFGDVAFAYPYSLLLIEIQDTLKSPPAENRVMKEASRIAVSITTFFYLGVGCFGYAAFGNNIEGNILTAFGSSKHCWLIDFANACIIVHLVGAYQVYSQPFFGMLDRWSLRKFQKYAFMNKVQTFKLPFFPAFKISLFTIISRTIYVASTTGVAIYFPYFNEILAVLGALNFWPITIYFPVEMYIVQKKIRSWTRKWFVLRIFSLICFVITAWIFVGSFVGIISRKLN